MSTKRKLRVEITAEDLATINTLREKINQQLQIEDNAKKAALILNFILQKNKSKK